MDGVLQKLRQDAICREAGILANIYQTLRVQGYKSAAPDISKKGPNLALSINASRWEGVFIFYTIISSWVHLGQTERIYFRYVQYTNEYRDPVLEPIDHPVRRDQFFEKFAVLVAEHDPKTRLETVLNPLTYDPQFSLVGGNRNG